MNFDSTFGQAKQFGNIPIGLPAGHQAKHLGQALAQTKICRIGATVPALPTVTPRRQDGDRTSRCRVRRKHFTGEHLVQNIQQTLTGVGFGDKAGCATLHRFAHGLRVIERRKDHNRHGRIAFAKGFKARKTIDSGQTQVEKYQIEAMAVFKQRDRTIIIGNCRNLDLIGKLAQCLNKPLPYKGVIFNNKQFDHGSTKTAKQLFGILSSPHIQGTVIALRFLLTFPEVDKCISSSCDNTFMNEDLKNQNTTSPVVRDENGELSLHFNFPTIQSRMRVSDPGRLVLDYTRTMMGFLLLQPKPERIAMIGLGGGSLAKYCRLHMNECDFTAVELSPDVIALRHTFGVPDDDDHFRVLCADGADFVRREIDAFDVLLIDGFDSEGQPQQLCSAEFYDNCHGALRQGGILVANLCADDTGYGRYVARICAAFDDKVLVVEADEGENKIVFACKDGRFPPTFNELTTRLRVLESIHSVDLDATAQKILRGGNSPRAKPRKRR